jgi:hypothetical protein
MNDGVMKALTVPLQIRIERWSEALRRLPDDVKVVIQFNPT